MAIFSMSVSVDGFVSDRDGDFGWTVPTDEVFRAHLEQVGALGAYVMGRRLYETMRVWETDPALRSDPDRAAFADVWAALPKVVFSRTLDRVDGNARLARASLEEELAAAGEPVAVGGAALAAAAIERGLVDDFRLFRYPVVLGGGTPYFPPVRLPLALVETRTFGDVIFERYSTRGVPEVE